MENINSILLPDENYNYQGTDDIDKEYNSYIYSEVLNQTEVKPVKIECMETSGSLNQKKMEVPILNENKQEPKKILLGRKKKNSNIKGKHNKYSGDNIIKKIKSNLLNNLAKLINIRIKKIYNNNIGYGIFQKQLLKMNQRQVVNSKDNKLFIFKTLKEIFSDDISTKYVSYSISHNKDLIQELINERDEEKRIKFNKLFNLTFFDCLKHFRGNEYIEELQGLDSIDNILEKFKEDEDYLKSFKYYILNLEEILERKKNRNRNNKIIE
jgi:hypothetical protein